MNLNLINMTREFYNKNKEIIEAWGNGKTIQYRGKETSEWSDSEEPLWIEWGGEYRIKPEQKLVPFDFSDAEFLIGKSIKSKDNRVVTIISYIPCGDVVTTGGGVTRTFQYLLDNYTFLDGTPCGRIQES